VVHSGIGFSSRRIWERLAFGAQVEELELRYGRLNYKKLTGNGPSSGWVSIECKDGALLMRQGLLHRQSAVFVKAKNVWWLDWEELINEIEVPYNGFTDTIVCGSASLTPSYVGLRDRICDILVFGATGMAGMLACAILERTRGRTWCISGRDPRKLSLLSQKFGHCPSFRGASQVGGAEEIKRLVSSARIVVDFSGPTFKVGTVIVEACIQTGTHYIDTSAYGGDVDFVGQVRESLDAKAMSAGISLVFFCSAYPVQVDFGVWRMVRHLREMYNLQTRCVDVYQNLDASALSGTALMGFVGPEEFDGEQKDGWHFKLGGERQEGVQEEDMHAVSCVQHKDSGGWLVPGGLNAEIMITRCSCELFDRSESYGDRFLVKIWDLFPERNAAEGQIVHNRVLMDTYASQLAQDRIPGPGQGPGKHLRQRARPTRIFVAKADSHNRPPEAHFFHSFGPDGIGHPCDGTAALALLAADCLLDAVDTGQALRPGFGTPAWHLGHLGFYERMVGIWGGWSEVFDFPLSSNLFVDLARQRKSRQVAIDLDQCLGYMYFNEDVLVVIMPATMNDVDELCLLENRFIHDHEFLLRSMFPYASNAASLLELGLEHEPHARRRVIESILQKQQDAKQRCCIIKCVLHPHTTDQNSKPCIIGYTRAHFGDIHTNGVVWIGQLKVDEAYHKRGCATLLLAGVLKHIDRTTQASSSSARSLRLSVFEANRSAFKLYKKLGFEETSRHGVPAVIIEMAVDNDEGPMGLIHRWMRLINGSDGASAPVRP